MRQLSRCQKKGGQKKREKNASGNERNLSLKVKWCIILPLEVPYCIDIYSEVNAIKKMCIR